ncbi:MAG: hypothetical protein LUC30_07680 [Clostridiales bacterium]|nr:hypothetical protein [Clostridiales bacterium]
MTFYDKNGAALSVGDHIVPDDGLELVLVSSGYLADLDQDVLFGQQVKNLASFSILTQEDLSSQWTKKEEIDDEG